MDKSGLFLCVNKQWVFLLTTLIFCLISLPLNAQEFCSIQHYKKETGTIVLKEGAWLKKDRKKNNTAWKAANLFNLSTKNGFKKYLSVSQIRDFYAWFDKERIKQGRHIKSVGIAAVAAKQLSKVDNGFSCFFIIRNNEVVRFVNKGSKQVFEFSFKLIRDRFFSKNILSKEKAEIWDKNNGIEEQCHVLEALCQNLSIRALYRLEKMAKGKGIFKFAVPKRLRFKGDLINCEDRFRHGATILLREYNSF